MKSGRLISGFGFTGACLSCVAFAACGLFAPSREHFLIRVDSIAVPTMIAVADTLTVRFYGAIGPDGCWGLNRVDKQTTSASIDVTFHGEHQAHGGDCTAMPVALDHTEKLPPPLGTPFAITVHQPDGSLLQRLVTVQ